jgi:hypothetical protein
MSCFWRWRKSAEENHLMFSVRQWRWKSCITWARVSYASMARLEPSSFLLSLNEVAWFTELVYKLSFSLLLILLYCTPCNIYVWQHVNFVTLCVLCKIGLAHSSACIPCKTHCRSSFLSLAAPFKIKRILNLKRSAQLQFHFHMLYTLFTTTLST